MTESLQKEFDPKKVKEFDPDVLPTNGAVIWHKDYLIKKGKLNVNDHLNVKAKKIVTDMYKVWENLGVPRRVFKNAEYKVKAVLQKWVQLKGRPLPDADKLCDIACKCLSVCLH